MTESKSVLEGHARELDEVSYETSLAFSSDLLSDTATIRACRRADTEKRLRQAKAVLLYELSLEPTEEEVEAAAEAMWVHWGECDSSDPAYKGVSWAKVITATEPLLVQLVKDGRDQARAALKAARDTRREMISG